ncbi:MAG: putative transposase [Alphaproteobacteria bacterium]|nr:putative transposase [Alphaproteobacteria bacterium]
MRLITERGVSYAQAEQDLDVHQSQLRGWVKRFADDPQYAFPGQGQMKPEQLEIAQLKREVIKLKAERDILKKPRPTSRRNRREVRFHREAPEDLAGGVTAVHYLAPHAKMTPRKLLMDQVEFSPVGRPCLWVGDKRTAAPIVHPRSAYSVTCHYATPSPHLL